jgi:crotonobetainyl-CoA:carnitine CoA-transferase CaiB-like acyl-CoA transferase
MSGPLEGIRVLEQSIWQQGTVAGALLADMGADVVKLEGPENADPGRWFGGVDLPANPYFETNNRNKRSMVIDFKSAAALDAFHRMVASADVFLTNLRIPAVERMHLTYAELSTHNPRLVYGHGTGFGPKGPAAHEGAFDLIAQARSGMMSANSTPEGEPLQVGAPIADQVGGLMLAWGIVLALFHAQRTGKGQLVNSSILAGQIFAQGFQITNYLFGEQPGPRPMLARPERSSAAVLWNGYRAGDDRWFVIAQPHPHLWWSKFCEAIGRPELELDPVRGDIVRHPENSPRAIAYLDEVFLTCDRAHWLAAFRKINLPCSQIADYEELAADPQVLSNDLVVDYAHPAGEYRMVGIPVGLSETPGSIDRPAPEFGQHTEEVLLEYGFDWQEIESLRAMGAIGPRANVDNRPESFHF